MSLHIFRAKDQPATRFCLNLFAPDGKRLWIKNPRNRLLHANCCKKRRPAKNLVAHVYYDGTWLYCRRGKGCKRA